MKIEIQATSSDPANDILDVYDGGTRPICNIWQDDFCELLTDNQIKRLEDGCYKFDVNKKQLLDNARKIY